MNPQYNYPNNQRYASPTPRVGWSIINSTVVKMIVGTICIILLLRYLQSLSKDEDLQKKASAASTFGQNAYGVYKDFKQPNRMYNAYDSSRN